MNGLPSELERNLWLEEQDIYTAIDRLIWTGQMDETAAAYLQDREIGRFVLSLDDASSLDQMGIADEL